MFRIPVHIATPVIPGLHPRAGCAQTGKASGENLKHVVELTNPGKFRISVERRLPLEQANAAWEMNRGRHTRGKIILTISGKL